MNSPFPFTQQPRRSSRAPAVAFPSYGTPSATRCSNSPLQRLPGNRPRSMRGILPFYSFTLFCIVLPLTMFIPEAELPTWVIFFDVSILMTFLNILPSPKSIPFIAPYLLVENIMSVTKFNAMVSGLFQLGSSYQWIVTKKAGRSSESDLLATADKDMKSLI